MSVLSEPCKVVQAIFPEDSELVQSINLTKRNSAVFFMVINGKKRKSFNIIYISDRDAVILVDPLTLAPHALLVQKLFFDGI